MSASRVAIWKSAPFIRFLLPLIVGIVCQWYFQPAVNAGWRSLIFSLLILLFGTSISHFRRFQLSIINGVAVVLLFVSLGMLLAWYNDIRHDPGWFADSYRTGDNVIAVLLEPAAEKTNSYKAIATVKAITNGKRLRASRGQVIIYFQKDSISEPLDFASVIIFSRPLQQIKSAINPGGFDYKQYCLFQGITHQVHLRRTDFIILKERNPPVLQRFLFSIRAKVLCILRRYIPGEREQGLAEALLIGYKNDLDRDLVQSYTNTGVVHVIAISGLHLGLIYWLLVQLFRPLKKKKMFNWLSVLMIVAGLWLFSLIAGAQPSVLRSAVMFTCIVLGDSLSRKTSVYNSLALSAFVLLCVNPYWLWDVGFQLSYSAVLSIVIFMKPIYNWFYINNRILDFIWKLNAVSLAAQLLTTPFSIYHFHQFPNYFLLTNIVAVPLSSLVVLGEISLCAASSFAFLGYAVGRLLSWLIIMMNSYIERIESMPWSLWQAMQINAVQAALLLLAVTAFGMWLLENRKPAVWVGAFSLLCFFSLRSLSFYESGRQQIFIVYNIPKHQAIDVVSGRHCVFIGDTDLVVNEFAKNFHLKPSRILYRTTPVYRLPIFFHENNLLEFGPKRILLVDRNFVFDSCSSKIPIDILVISQDPKLHLLKLSKTFRIQQVVFDASVSRRRLKYWIRDCDSLHIPYYDVNEKGAFVMNLN